MLEATQSVPWTWCDATKNTKLETKYLSARWRQKSCLKRVSNKWRNFIFVDDSLCSLTVPNVFCVASLSVPNAPWRPSLDLVTKCPFWLVESFAYVLHIVRDIDGPPQCDLWPASVLASMLFLNFAIVLWYIYNLSPSVWFGCPSSALDGASNNLVESERNRCRHAHIHKKHLCRRDVCNAWHRVWPWRSLNRWNTGKSFALWGMHLDGAVARRGNSCTWHTDTGMPDAFQHSHAHDQNNASKCDETKIYRVFCKPVQQYRRSNWCLLCNCISVHDHHCKT